MKLLLTSRGTQHRSVMEELISLSGKKPQDTKILFITTAAKLVEKRDYMEEELERLQAEGFIVETYDIEGKNEKILARVVQAFDIIWVCGGKPFYLLRAVRESGFETVVKAMRDDQVYVGQSAGSFIACPTIVMALWKKPNRDTYGLNDYSGMGLVDFLVFVHYEEKHKALLEEKKKETPFTVYALTDEQAIRIDQGKVKLINVPD